MTTPIDLPTLDRLHAEASRTPWAIAAIVNTFPSLSARVKELEAENAIRTETNAEQAAIIRAAIEREHLLTETLRGVLQEKQDELASYGRPGPSFTRDKTIQQIAWLERVLRGGK